MCKVLHFNRSTYYKVIHHVSSTRASETQQLDADILRIYYDTKRRYGAPKIYNHKRKHSSLGYKTPDEVHMLRAWFNSRNFGVHFIDLDPLLQWTTQNKRGPALVDNSK